MTVIIPVLNAGATIQAVVSSVLKQCRAEDEVILVDDGSTDATPKALKELAQQSDGRVWIIRQSNTGPASARTTALRLVTADLVLLLGGDIVPAPALLERHRAIHRWYPEDTVGCLGHVTWDETLPPTPFMVWLEHGGPQNAYGMIAGRRWVNPSAFFYAANLSCKRSVLESVGWFDTAHFTTYGWEDLELGIRLASRGFHLFYEPAARAAHVHQHTVETWKVRQRSLGKPFCALARLHPALVKIPRGARGVRYLVRVIIHKIGAGKTLTHLASRAQRRFIIPWLYEHVSAWEFLRSVHDSSA